MSGNQKLLSGAMASRSAGEKFSLCAGASRNAFVPSRGSWIGAVCFLLALPRIQAEIETYDVVVYGGSSAGVIAAVQAAEMGKSTLLISQFQHVGGMTSSGLGNADVGTADAIGGLTRTFYNY